MDTTLDEDFVNFEAVAQTCALSLPDEELCLLDSEETHRELISKGKMFFNSYITKPNKTKGFTTNKYVKQKLNIYW